MIKTRELRQIFLNYFKERGHQIIPSSSLVPHNDSTLLFTNAGMVQFKDVFLGQEKKPYHRAVTVQRCVRAGGKHNDLENVGFTARHHTFFEMLGNFSFGDYFKREAIHYAWDFLTNQLQLPKEKLWVTVYEEDDEAEEIWLKEIGVDSKRCSRCGMKDNFWAMGETGPCGPCSEIFYDHGPEIAGGPPGTPDEEGDRYVEIWNLVFMQYERNDKGELSPLPKPSIDTGMGLERIAAVVQGVQSNYDIDLFKALIGAAASITACDDLTKLSLKVLADHIRSSAFLITDGVIPSNEGRGYVLRRLIRRAVRHGNKLGINEPFFYRLVQPLVEVMGEAYLELRQSQSLIERYLLQEEEQFARTLQQGLTILEEDIATLKGSIIPGSTLFKLYDTYGFPVDLTQTIASERGLTIDEAGFQNEMEKQRQQSMKASQFKVDYTNDIQVDGETEFTGYDTISDESTVVAIFQDNASISELFSKEAAAIILNKTPFYAESGGQAGDRGVLQFEQGEFAVQDTRKQGKVYIHFGHLKTGQLKVGDSLLATVNEANRQSIALHHSATHLLHAVLREVLGAHVIQKGSLVDADHLRFDFSHAKPIEGHQLQLVEQRVNAQIRANVSVETEMVHYDEAIQKGAMALFGEKYEENVRVLRIGDFSLELCGGTHVKQTGEIGLFKIVSEFGIASGIRRIEAKAGESAYLFVRKEENVLNEMSRLLKTDQANLFEKFSQIMQHQRELDKMVSQLKNKIAKNNTDTMLSSVQEIGGVKVLITTLSGVENKLLRAMVDQLKDKLGKGIIVLASIQENKSISVIAGVTKNCTERFNASELLHLVTSRINGKGGGRSDLAQGGGSNIDALPEALKVLEEKIKEHP